VVAVPYAVVYVAATAARNRVFLTRPLTRCTPNPVGLQVKSKICTRELTWGFGDILKGWYHYYRECLDQPRSIRGFSKFLAKCYLFLTNRYSGLI